MKDNKSISTKRRALVAGGAGFVGSHLCRRLLEMEYSEVICVDSLLTGRLENVSSLLSSPKFTFIRHDIIDPLSIEGGFDEIYNLACPASPKQYQKDPIHTFKTSVLGSINLLDLAREKGATILLASTSEVYGDPTLSVQKENYWGNVNPNGLRSCYDEGKRGAETLFCDYYRQYGVDTRIVRIFNTYGPGMRNDDGRVVSNFISQALTGNPLTIYGDGEQTRSFQYISDLIDGLVSIMRTSLSATPINIGNPSEIKVIDLARTVLRLTDSHSPVRYCPLPLDDPKRRCPDISLATMSLVEWKPRIDIEDGLKRTINYFSKSAII